MNVKRANLPSSPRMRMRPTARDIWRAPLGAALMLGALCWPASAQTPPSAALGGPAADPHPWMNYDEDADAVLTPEEFALALMQDLRPLDINDDRLVSREEFLVQSVQGPPKPYAAWFEESDFDGDGAWSVGELEDYLVLRFLEYDIDEDGVISVPELPDQPNMDGDLEF